MAKVWIIEKELILLHSEIGMGKIYSVSTE